MEGDRALKVVARRVANLETLGAIATEGEAVKKLIVWWILAGAVSGCASNVEVAYPGAPTPASGVLLVRLTEPMRSVSVRVDGSLVVEDKHTERVEIRGVPTGERDVTVVASEGWRAHPINHREQVMVRPDQAAAILIATPPPSTGYWIRSAVGLLVSGAVYVLLDPLE